MNKIKIVKLIDAEGNVFGVNQDGGDLIILAKAMGYTGSTFQLARLDPVTFVPISIDTAHHHIHDGSSYHAFINAVGASGTKATLTFKTPNTSKLIHIVVGFRANVESLITCGEASTVTGASGSDFTPVNRNRNSSTTSGLITEGSAGGAGKITQGATVTNFGTILHIEHIGDGKQEGGEARGTHEWVLKPDTVYAIEVETEAASSEAHLELDWYEHISLE